MLNRLMRMLGNSGGGRTRRRGPSRLGRMGQRRGRGGRGSIEGLVRRFLR
jgi:hypothetical protein